MCWQRPIQRRLRHSGPCWRQTPRSVQVQGGQECSYKVVVCECSPARYDLSPITPQRLLHVSRLTKSTFEPCWRQRYARTARGGTPPTDQYLAAAK